MHLWFARNGIISIRDQLVTQLMLAIASAELPPGKRLPSTRALAKRFELHPNTVSAAYQQLQALGWVESLHGSGVYVRTGPKQQADEAQRQALDRLVRDFLQGAKAAGVTARAAQSRLNQAIERQPRRFAFAHPDHGLRGIICQELRHALSWEILNVETDAATLSALAADSLLLTLPSKCDEIRALLPPDRELVAIQVRSVADSLAPYLPVRPEVMMFIVSGWPPFLDVARTVLTAAGYDPDALLFCDTNADGWTRGLGAGSVVVCDVVTAPQIPAGAYKIVFPLVSESALAELKTYQQFHS